MRRLILLACAEVALCTGSLSAFDAVGILKKVDAAKGLVYLHAGGQDRTVKMAADVKILDDNGKPLADGLQSRELKEGAVVTVSVERGNDGPMIKAIRLGKHAADRRPSRPAGKELGKPTVGFKPLTEMSASDEYKSEDGGLYGAGKNQPPEAHAAAAHKEIGGIVPLDEEGKSSANGKIGLISISMSNATMEFSLFKQLADRDPRKAPSVAIVDCAQGGQAMAEWVGPRASAWAQADLRLAKAAVNPKQVQVVWIKLANKQPRGNLAEHAKQLQKDTRAVLQNAKVRFPNLRVAFLSSRIYGGWANSPLNPEPYAYEGAFAVRWLIRDQIAGNPKLCFDPSRGTVVAPLLLWGPYLWADGTTPRKSDGLVWPREDLAGDGVHPSATGRQKVADLLVKFFTTDTFARSWFSKE